MQNCKSLEIFEIKRRQLPQVIRRNKPKSRYYRINRKMQEAAFSAFMLTLPVLIIAIVVVMVR